MTNSSPFKEEFRDFFLITLLSPLLGLIKLSSFKSKSFFVIGSMIMMGLFGLFYAYPEDSDGHTHYMHSLEDYSFMSFTFFITESWNILSQKPTIGKTDLYIHFLSFFSNSILGLPKTLHFWAGIILGLAISKTLILILDKSFVSSKYTKGTLLLIILLLVHGFYNLNAIRLGTGAWVLIYGSIGYFLSRKKYYLLFIILAMQIHFAYTMIALPAIASFFLYKRKVAILFIWAISFFAQSSFSYFESYVPQTEIFQDKAQDYVMEGERLENFKANRASRTGNFYATLGPTLYYDYAILILTIGFVLTFIESTNKLFDYTYVSTLLYLSFSNIVNFIPSLEGRLTGMASMFLLLSVLIYYKYKDNYAQMSIKSTLVSSNSILLFLILSIPFILKNIVQMMITTEPFIIFFPIFKILLNESISIRDLLG